MLHHPHAAWKVRRGAGAKHALHDKIRIAQLSARPMRTSPLVASCRPWVLAGMLDGPNSRAALSSRDVAKFSSGCSLYTGASMFLGNGVVFGTMQ